MSFAHQFEPGCANVATLNMLSEEVSALQHGREAIARKVAELEGAWRAQSGKMSELEDASQAQSGKMDELEDASRAQSQAWRESFAEVKAPLMEIRVGLGLPESEPDLWQAIRGLLKQHRASMQQDEVDRGRRRDAIERSPVPHTRPVVLSAWTPRDDRQSGQSARFLLPERASRPRASPRGSRQSPRPALRQDRHSGDAPGQASHVHFNLRDTRHQDEDARDARDSVDEQFGCLQAMHTLTTGRGRATGTESVARNRGVGISDSGTASHEFQRDSWELRSTVAEQFDKLSEAGGASVGLKDLEDSGVQSAQPAHERAAVRLASEPVLEPDT